MTPSDNNLTRTILKHVDTPGRRGQRPATGERRTREGRTEEDDEANRHHRREEHMNTLLTRLASTAGSLAFTAVIILAGTGGI
jgi:hypothetical protein